MARTFKKGLDYFPLDIDIFNDLKISTKHRKEELYERQIVSFYAGKKWHG